MKQCAWMLAVFTCISLPAWAEEEVNTATQFSLMGALLQGVLEGETTVRHLHRHGNFGIGTFNGLDGEMVMLDGKVYQARADGRVVEVVGTAKIPYATVGFFRADRQQALPKNTAFEGLAKVIKLQDPNTPYFIRIDGLFTYMKARAPHRQRKPYPSFEKILSQQAVFEFSDVEGTLVGFYFPPYAKGLNVPGYHLHFISKDRRAGGHALGFTAKKAKIALAKAHRWVLELPRGNAFQAVDFTQDGGTAMQAVTSKQSR